MSAVNNENTRQIWYKDIKQPWLDMLESGVKEYEGRIVRKDWKTMQRDDVIVFNDGNKSLSFKILGFVYAKNFGDLYFQLGSKLVPYPPSLNLNVLTPNVLTPNVLTPSILTPSVLTPDDVESIYENIFGMSLEQIEKYGVVGIKLQLI